MKQRPLGNVIHKAWLAGWDASLTYAKDNPYTRQPQAKAFERGKAAGFRQGDGDIKTFQRFQRMARKAAP